MNIKIAMQSMSNLLKKNFFKNQINQNPYQMKNNYLQIIKKKNYLIKKLKQLIKEFKLILLNNIYQKNNEVTN